MNNRSAVTIKDESRITVDTNYFIGNEIDIEMYQKKSFFEFPTLNIAAKTADNLNIVASGKSTVNISQE